jgi:acyl carrier protein
MGSIEQAVRILLAEKADLDVPVGQIGIDDNLLNYGLHSVLYVQLVVAIEVHFGIEFDDLDLDIHAHPTIGSLVAYIQRQQSRAQEHSQELQ